MALSPFADETMTISSTSMGLSSSSNYSPTDGILPTWVKIMVLTNSMRVREAGTPTASVGMYFNAEDYFILDGYSAIQQVRMIRATSSDATILVTWYR